MTAFISLFRGINVGGNHQVKMSELKAMHEALELRNVLPYIQSGNVIFHSDEADAALLRERIEQRFETTFGFHSEVMLRTAAEFDAIVASNPFQGQPGKAPQYMVVMFLAARPDAAAQEELRASYAGPEEFFIIGQEAHLYYPEGQGRSKLSGSFLERKLKTPGTARNWNTVLQLQKLLHS